MAGGGDSLEQRIRERAHHLWESAGSPDGQEEHFWLLAEKEITAAERSAQPEPAGENGAAASRSERGAPARPARRASK